MGMGFYNNYNNFNQGLSLQGSYNTGNIWGNSSWSNFDSGLSLQGPYKNFGSIWGTPSWNNFGNMWENPFYDSYGTFSSMPRMMSFDEFCAACKGNEPKNEGTTAANTKTNAPKESAPQTKQEKPQAETKSEPTVPKPSTKKQDDTYTYTVKVIRPDITHTRMRREMGLPPLPKGYKKK